MTIQGFSLGIDQLVVMASIRPIVTPNLGRSFVCLASIKTKSVQQQSPGLRKVVASAKGSRKDDRQTWFASSQSLTYLDGSLPGDSGFDPLGLSDPQGAGAFIDPAWLAYAEVAHGRWAMLGACGMLAPESLGRAGVIPAATGVEWFRSGVIPPLGAFDYWADPYALFAAQIALVGFAEHRRAQDYYSPGYGATSPFLGLERLLGGSRQPSYPGGPLFNFARLGRSREETHELRCKEVKHGRLAMLACLGFFLQALVTGYGPWQNLLDHVTHPLSNNVLSYVGLL